MKHLLIILLSIICITKASALDKMTPFGDFNDTIYIDFYEHINNDTLQLDFVVSSFEDITSFQWTLNFTEDLKFHSLISDVVGSTHFNVTNGKITFAWFSQNTDPISLQDSTVLFSLKFHNTEQSEGNFQLGDTPTVIEVINNDLEQVAVVVGAGGSFTGSRLVEGLLYADLNGNCTYDEGEYPLTDWIMTLSNGQVVKTDINGTFRKRLSVDNYSIALEPKNEVWSPCENSLSFTIDDSSNSTIELDLGVKAIVLCPRPEISIVNPTLINCIGNPYQILYCNYGSERLEVPEITLNFSEDLIFVSSPITPSTITETSITILGEALDIGECKVMYLIFEPNCETTAVGETHCIEASIGPFENCIENENWTGADIVVEASCDDEEATFKIKNRGSGDMANSRSFIVIEDDVMMPQQDNEFDIDAGDSILLSLPANGKTWRLIAEQEEFHPFPNMPTVALEGCGESEDGSVSYGYINQFGESDNAPFTDIFCSEIIATYAKNDLQGFPEGFGPENMVYEDTDIEYLIRFQNTGEDTARTVIVASPIHEGFDLGSLQVGPGSHPFTWRITNERTLEFTFENILLPASSSSDPASKGFIKYKLSQVEDNVKGTILKNLAYIALDSNLPIITNTTQHTVGGAFLLSDIVDNSHAHSEQKFKIYPNPTQQGLWIEQVQNASSAEIIIYSTEGRLILRKNINDGLNYISKSELYQGLNFYTITTAEGRTYSGKITVLK